MRWRDRWNEWGASLGWNTREVEGGMVSLLCGGGIGREWESWGGFVDRVLTLEWAVFIFGPGIVGWAWIRIVGGLVLVYLFKGPFV